MSLCSCTAPPRWRPKITLPAPSTMHFYRCTDFADRGVYPDLETFFADLARIVRAGDRGSGRGGLQIRPAR